MPGITTPEAQADQAIDQAGRKNPSLHRILTYLLAEAGGDTTALEARIAANETDITTVQAIALANSSSITVNETAIALNTAKQTGLILGWASTSIRARPLWRSSPPSPILLASAGDGVDVEQFVADAVTYDGLAVDAGTYIVAGVSFRGQPHRRTRAVNVRMPAFPTDGGWTSTSLSTDVIYELTVGQQPQPSGVYYSEPLRRRSGCWPDSAVSGIGLLAMKLL